MYIIKHKSDTFDKFKEHKNLVENLVKKGLKNLGLTMSWNTCIMSLMNFAKRKG